MVVIDQTLKLEMLEGHDYGIVKCVLKQVM